MNQQQTTPPVNSSSDIPEVKARSSQFLKRVREIQQKIPEPIKTLFNKFYSNKKIFWPITIAFGLIFLTLILGVIFGGKTPITPKKMPSPTPSATMQPQSTPEVDNLSLIQEQLSKLKEKIDTLDVGQSRIKPPTINFDIKF